VMGSGESTRLLLLLAGMATLAGTVFSRLMLTRNIQEGQTA
jgi:hypothetical protein